ncbi:hypothetical protein MHBO_000757 [Bonamia ostreae]|uniref:Uncharacterized protein n=1 Tax=Bonamia ostreae TaxID=126728 RepID=A0ABV2AGP3_9EUKA
MTPDKICKRHNEIKKNQKSDDDATLPANEENNLIVAELNPNTQILQVHGKNNQYQYRMSKPEINTNIGNIEETYCEMNDYKYNDDLSLKNYIGNRSPSSLSSAPDISTSAPIFLNIKNKRIEKSKKSRLMRRNLSDKFDELSHVLYGSFLFLHIFDFENGSKIFVNLFFV